MRGVLQEMADLETIDISENSVVVLKHHGSYMQQNRDLQRTDKAGYAASYQFMLRLKNPCGKVDPATYKCIDDLSEKYGQKDLRATTRQAFQLHGVKKKDLNDLRHTKGLSNTQFISDLFARRDFQAYMHKHYQIVAMLFTQKKVRRVSFLLFTDKCIVHKRDRTEP